MAKVERISAHFGTKVPGRHDYSNITVSASMDATLEEGDDPLVAWRALQNDCVALVRQSLIERFERRPKSERTGDEQEQIDALSNGGE